MLLKVIFLIEWLNKFEGIISHKKIKKKSDNNGEYRVLR